jgi:hypothetical protein
MLRPSNELSGEEGASLIIALVFVLLISLILLAIVTLSGTNILNTANLQNERSLEYSADGEVEAAIQAVRYLDTASTISYCKSSHSYQIISEEDGSMREINGIPVGVSCGVDPQSVDGRTVTFKAYRCTSASECVNGTANANVVEATVLISDVSSVGSSVTVENWIATRANG